MRSLPCALLVSLSAPALAGADLGMHGVGGGAGLAVIDMDDPALWVDVPLVEVRLDLPGVNFGRAPHLSIEGGLGFTLFGREHRLGFEPYVETWDDDITLVGLLIRPSIGTQVNDWLSLRLGAVVGLNAYWMSSDRCDDAAGAGPIIGLGVTPQVALTEKLHLGVAAELAGITVGECAFKFDFGDDEAPSSFGWEPDAGLEATFLLTGRLSYLWN